MAQLNSIFIIDDDPDDIELLQAAFGQIAPRVSCSNAKDCIEAYEKLETMSDLPDMIFLDLNLPMKDGRKCLGEIKENPRLKHIPIIIYTTSKAQSDIDETKRLGAYHYITKPNSYSELCEYVAAIAAGKLP